MKATPGITRRTFLYNLSRAEYEKEWDGKYERPGPFARTMAFLFRLLPKVGPFKAISFRTPTPETARLFMMSFNRTLEDYRGLLAKARAGQRSTPPLVPRRAAAPATGARRRRRWKS